MKRLSLSKLKDLQSVTDFIDSPPESVLSDWYVTKELPYPQDASTFGYEFGDSPDYYSVKVKGYSGHHKACYMYIEGEDEDEAAWYTNMFSKIVVPVIGWYKPI